MGQASSSPTPQEHVKALGVDVGGDEPQRFLEGWHGRGGKGLRKIFTSVCIIYFTNNCPNIIILIDTFQKRESFVL